MDYYNYPHTDLNAQNQNWLIQQMKYLIAEYDKYENPVVVEYANQMVDTTKIYIYQGNEAGFNTTHWYFWYNDAWTDGGKWGSVDITDEALQTAVNTWLNAHPEATTTVQDGSITTAKLADDVVDSLVSNNAKYTLLTLFDNVAYTINNGYTLVNDFMLKLFPNQEHPLANGTHTFSSNNRVLTITNGNHIHFENPGATSSITPIGGYLDLSTVSQNDNSGTTTSNINKNTTIFTIPADANVTFKVFNISYEKLNDEAFFNIGLRQNSTSKWTVGNNATNIETSNTFSFDTDTPITCVFMYIRSPFRTFDCDIAMFVDGERWI